MTAIINQSGLAKLTIPELKDALAKQLGYTVTALTNMACIWRELVSRGVDLSDLRRGLCHWVSQIAAGRLTAEAVIGFNGDPAKLRAVEGLPLDRQRELANGGCVTLYDPNTKSALAVPFNRLPNESIYNVIRNGRELSLSEQQITGQPKKKAARKPDTQTARKITAAARVRCGSGSNWPNSRTYKPHSPWPPRARAKPT